MTPEQVDLEFAHIAHDRQLADGNKQVYVDEDYEQYDQDTEEQDSRLSGLDSSVKTSEAIPKNGETSTGEWKDVEIDYLDSEEP